jgi:hypothetical protein
MAMQLDAVVPFGRSLDEYTRMFTLTPQDLSQRILGVGDGPASFNAEATAQRSMVVSIDPIYCFSGAEILHRFDAVVDSIMYGAITSPLKICAIIESRPSKGFWQIMCWGRRAIAINPLNSLCCRLLTGRLI